MLGDGYSYVRAPMPEGSEFAFMNIGVKLENGAPGWNCIRVPGQLFGAAAGGAGGLRLERRRGGRLVGALRRSGNGRKAINQFCRLDLAAFC